MSEHTCLNCGLSEKVVPLVNLSFKGETKYICGQCLPVFIHKPQQLVDKLPGFTPPAVKPHEH